MTKLDHLDHMLSQLIEILDRYSEEDLMKNPAPDVWSPVQLLTHVRLSEDISMAYVRKKLGFDPVLKKVGFTHAFKSSINSFILRCPIKIKAPNGAAEKSFPSDLSYKEEIQKWKMLRSDTRNYIEELDAKWLDKDVFKHPFAGRLSLEQMVDFFNGHFKRHRKQIMARLPENAM